MSVSYFDSRSLRGEKAATRWVRTRARGSQFWELTVEPNVCPRKNIRYLETTKENAPATSGWYLGCRKAPLMSSSKRYSSLLGKLMREFQVLSMWRWKASPYMTFGSVFPSSIMLIQVEFHSGMNDPSQIRRSFFPGFDRRPWNIMWICVSLN